MYALQRQESEGDYTFIARSWSIQQLADECVRSEQYIQGQTLEIVNQYDGRILAEYTPDEEDPEKGVWKQGTGELSASDLILLNFSTSDDYTPTHTANERLELILEVNDKIGWRQPPPGPELAKLYVGIAKIEPVEWKGPRYDTIIRLFCDNFPPEHPVWTYIVLEEEDPDHAEG